MAVRDGRRAEFAAFGWKPDEVPDPQDPATFERSRLDWQEPEREPHATLLDWHRRLIGLRRALPALRDGRLDRVRCRVDEEAGWLVLERGPVTVAVNLGPEAVTLEVGGPILLASDGVEREPGGGVRLPPDTVAVAGRRPG
jgi:maltooligosyltrehalose trehalohydrolase